MDKYLVVCSGGQDSTTCLAWAIEKAGGDSKKVECITFKYGQIHSIELEKAAFICREASIRQKIVDVSNLATITTSSLLDGSDIIPNSDGTPSSKVEGRNMLFLTYAAIYAKSRGIKNIVTGVCETDFSGYPDCRDTFVKSCQVALNLALDYPITIHTPLMWLDKAQTWRLAFDLGAFKTVYEHTHTCYKGVEGGCHECPSCKLREKGFKKFYKALSDEEKAIVDEIVNPK